MDARAAERLELPAVRERLAARCRFEAGRARALALVPAWDGPAVAELQAQTAEALGLLEAGVGGPDGAHAIDAEVEDATRGGVLGADRLELVSATVAVGLERAEALAERVEDAPLLAGRLEEVPRASLLGLAATFEPALDGRGGLADGASIELGRARRGLRRARRDAADLARHLAGRLGEHLQEEFVTERGGRPVLAVRASSKGAVPGIVHAASASGQTLFVEPLAMVESGNRVRELEQSEAIEEERVLRSLSAAVGARGAELQGLVDALATLDLAIARAELSSSWAGCRVEAAQEVALFGARHPLLDAATAVPIDLDLRGLRALVVSGPNAGGKTVALKTLGLCALLHQCGLRPPARRALMPVFARVVAEIGDDQSIELSLSTFSARVRALAAVLEEADPASLVLLDEIAAGTDPVEGAALAQAVLARLVERGALVMATTHHPDLKEWAAAEEMAGNAAVAVDARTLAPRYELIAGEPGASHALDIAERFGLDPGVVAAAREAVDPDRRSAERLLVEASEARAAAERALGRARDEADAAASSHRRARAAEAELERAQERSRADAKAAREAARAAAASELAGLERELAELRAQIAAARRGEEGRAAEDEAASERASERDRRLGAAVEAVRRARAELHEHPRRPAALAVGDRVRDPLMGVRGTVLALRGEEAEVQGPSARLRVPAWRLEPDADPPPSGPSRPAPRQAAPPPPGGELDVRGQRAVQARAAVRTGIDGAAVAGVPFVRVVHGVGTGALRAAVREELDEHPLVDRAEGAPPHEGGEGATIAYLEG